MSLDHLNERELLELAIHLEEDTEQVYSDLAESLRPEFASSASVFERMRQCQSTNRCELVELYKRRFGDWSPLIERRSRDYPQESLRPISAPSQTRAQGKARYPRSDPETARPDGEQILVQGVTDNLRLNHHISDTRVRPKGKDAAESKSDGQDRRFVLQVVQPALEGLMDGSVSTLAPVFAAAVATHNSWYAFVVGLAASLGAGISMGFAEALSDDGKVTGRGHPLMRGLVCGAMTMLGGIGHTLPFLMPAFQLAMTIAILVVLVELGAITWIRHRYMNTPVFAAATQIGLGGALVFVTGLLIGKS